MTTPDEARPCAGCGPAVGRRGALLGAAGTVLLTACGGGSSPQRAQAASDPVASAPAPAAGSGALARLADLPEGTALAAKAPDGQPLLLVRTGPAQVTGYSARCPHQGCTVAPAGDALACPCHGSRFDLTGKRTAGPAPRGLTPFPVAVSGDDVVPA